MGDLIKNNKQQRIQHAKASNTRERNIAKQYFTSGPSIGNLARAAYHWWNSVPGLGGEDESGNIVIGGEAPTPGIRNPKSIVKGVKPVVKIVKENAAKITPSQWTVAQDAAIARGDMSEAQRLRDLHFKVKAPNTQIVDKKGNPLLVYHGTNKNFTEFKLGMNPEDEGVYGRGLYFTNWKTYADEYGRKRMNVYLNSKNPRTVAEYDFSNNGKEIVDNDGVIANIELIDKNAYEYAIPKPNQIKLADAITFDDNGVRIPLGERDNFNINDIRYGLLPIIGGLGAYSVNKKKQGGQIIKDFKQKFQFGGKYTYYNQKNPPIKTSYGYPVYWSNNVPEEYKWVTNYLKNNPDITGMAVGEGAQGLDDVGPRVIIRNSHSNILTDPNDSRWNGLDKIEAVRHYMNETNYNPYFKISPEQEYFRRTKFSKDAPYNTDDNAWRQSIISRLIAGDMEGTPEQMKIVDKFKKDFQKQRGFWEKF